MTSTVIQQADATKGRLFPFHASSDPAAMARMPETGEEVAPIIAGNVITARGAGCAIPFGHAIVSLALGRDAADRVTKDMQCL